MTVSSVEGILTGRRSERLLHGISSPEASQNGRVRHVAEFRPLFSGHTFPVVFDITKLAVLGGDWGRRVVSAPDSGCNGVLVRANPACEFCGVNGFTLKLNSVIRAAIRGLLCARGPLAVSRFVVSVVINSVDGVRWRRLSPHIRKEVFERVNPSLADRNAATAVVMEPDASRHVASPLHGFPGLVLGALADTSAIADVTIRKDRSRKRFLSSTVASAEPATSFNAILNLLSNHYESAKTQAIEVFLDILARHEKIVPLRLRFGDPNQNKISIKRNLNCQ